MDIKTSSSSNTLGTKPQMKSTHFVVEQTIDAKFQQGSTVQAKGKISTHRYVMSPLDSSCDPAVGDPEQHCCPYGTYYSGEDSKCCDDGDVLVKGHCCPAGSSYSTDDNKCCDQGTDPAQHCCPYGTFYGGNDGKCCNDGDTVVDGHCCPAGLGFPGDGGRCCDAGSDPAEHCCPYGTFYSGAADKCCNAGDIVAGGHCCPAGSTYSSSDSKCCDIDGDLSKHCCPFGTYWSGEGDKCCNDGDTFVHGHCCPAGSNYAADGDLCCPDGTDPNQHCCEFGTFYSGHDDTCCNDGDIYENGHCCTIGQEYEFGICGHADTTQGLTLPSSGHDFSSDNGAALILFAALFCGLLFWFAKNRQRKSADVIVSTTGGAYFSAQHKNKTLYAARFGANNIQDTEADTLL